jgi:hypothetical protein
MSSIKNPGYGWGRVGVKQRRVAFRRKAFALLFLNGYAQHFGRVWLGFVLDQGFTLR